MHAMKYANTKARLFARLAIQVLWFRNSFSIQPTDRHLMTSRNGRHMLQIKNLQTEDFGNYRYAPCKSDPVQALSPELLFAQHLSSCVPIHRSPNPLPPPTAAWPRTRWAA